MRYAIITGTGRSGTNWLLDTLDTSPGTHCRNEPHGIPGTPLNEFPVVWTSPHAGSIEVYRERWDQVARATAARFGVRDHNIKYPKPYLHPWSNRLDVSRLMTGPRARTIVSHVDRRLGGTEWPMPWWVGSQRRMERSLGVLKVLIDAPLLRWILIERPEVRVVHIVRHPGGRLHSWLTRLLGPMNGEQRTTLHAHRVRRIEFIRAFDGSWAEIIPDPAGLSIVELELWFWRYVNESKLEAGAGLPGYRLVRFDDLAHDPVQQSQMVFRHVGLEWTDEVASRVREGTSTSVFGAVSDPRAVADAWRGELDEAHVASIDRVIDNSPLAALLSTTP